MRSPIRWGQQESRALQCHPRQGLWLTFSVGIRRGAVAHARHRASILLLALGAESAPHLVAMHSDALVNGACVCPAGVPARPGQQVLAPVQETEVVPEG
jgi:hypothetical protein